MGTNKTDNRQLFILLALLAAAFLAWYLLRVSALPLILALIMVGLKVAGLYMKKRNPLGRLLLFALSLSLWLSLFIGMFFTETTVNSLVGDFLAVALKKVFGWFSYVVLVSPIFYLGWKLVSGAKTRCQHKRDVLHDAPLVPDVVESVAPTAFPVPVTSPAPPPAMAHYKTPPLDLLRDYPTPSVFDDADMKQQIRQTLSDFGINVADVRAAVGANVTLYELILERGVSANKIKTLDDDIARSLKVESVRVIPSMGVKGTVGLEVPNGHECTVGIKEILETDEFQHTAFKLPLAIGKTIDGRPRIIDLVDMPHILVAGATGQGKSVGINAMIVSLLYKKTPDELRFVLIDPKLVELGIYDKIGKVFMAELPGVEQAVVTNDKSHIATALQALCDEMDRRLRLFKEAGCRDLADYKAKHGAAAVQSLPYIVVIIDEFADLMLKTSGTQSVRSSLIRLAQIARASGIHLIVATQRPSAKVVVGEISANFPARIAYRVSKQVDSQIILDSGGAEKLVGRGDLILSVNARMERIQGAFISAKEIELIVKIVKNGWDEQLK